MFVCFRNSTKVSIAIITSTCLCVHTCKYLCRVDICTKDNRLVWLEQRVMKEERFGKECEVQIGNGMLVLGMWAIIQRYFLSRHVVSLEQCSKTTVWKQVEHRSHADGYLV